MERCAKKCAKKKKKVVERKKKGFDRASIVRDGRLNAVSDKCRDFWRERKRAYFVGNIWQQLKPRAVGNAFVR
jgi:hypothetical protein